MGEITTLQIIAELVYPSRNACCGSKASIKLDQSRLILKYSRILSGLTAEEKQRQLGAWLEEAREKNSR